MISDMRKMAEAFLANSGGNGPDEDAGKEGVVLESFCERQKPGTPVYLLHPTQAGQVAVLRRQELHAGHSWRAPFIKVAPNAAYLVPVFKVDRKKGIKEYKRQRTIEHFQQQASESKRPMSEYFEAVVRLLKCRIFRNSGEDPQRGSDAYSAAVQTILANNDRRHADKATPLLIVALDEEGEVWPGDDPRLVRWLLESDHRLTIYGKSENELPASCSLCESRAPLFANALFGAGLNFLNRDFKGSFSNADPDTNDWRRFAICSECAELLYTYKNHVAPHFLEQVVGSKALIIPSANVGGETKEFGRFIKEVKRMTTQASRIAGEQTVLRRLSGEITVATLSLLWADNFGQKIDGIRGFVTHILPTRLAELDAINSSFNRHASLLYPRDLRSGVRRSLDLNLRLADELLRRPGGQKVKAENQSPRRRDLLYRLAECVFHRERRIDRGILWQEIDRTAEAYWRELIQQENAGVLYQCNQEAPKQYQGDRWLPLTVNGWVRHLFLFLDYLSDDRVNVLPKENAVYEPTQDSLRPLFAEAKGLDTDGKRFTFLLGILYGHLIYVQARHAEVNVASNALSWMRGGRLRAAELHELYGKIAGKLLEYHALEVGRYRKFKAIYELETEIGQIGKRFPIPIRADELPDEQVLFFLMLGMALSYDFTTSGMSKTKGEEQ